jgi:putative PIN family toxin of toxin-antitoxin system
MVTRIILDSNVWAIYAYGNKLARLIYLSENFKIELLYTGQILKEVFTTCSKPAFQEQKVDPYYVIEVIRKAGRRVVPNSQFVLGPDKKDNFLFDAYIQYHAHYLVTEEKILLKFVFRRIRVRNIQWLKENFPH